MKRKMLIILSGLMLAVASLTASPAPVLAAGDDKACGGSVLGLRPWYYNICETVGNDVQITKPAKSEAGLSLSLIHI